MLNPQKVVWVDFKHKAAVTLYKNSENFNALTFHKT